MECSVRRLAHDRCLCRSARGWQIFLTHGGQDGSTGFDFAGTYTKIIEPKLIEYSFGDRKAQVEFTPGQTGVKVRVTFDSESTHSIEQQRQGWQSILNNFARYVQASRKTSD